MLTDSMTIESDGKKVGISATCSRFFPWCGFLFDRITGEVRVDYQRYVAGDSLTVGRVSNPGQCFRIQALTFVRPRCQAILYDSLINSDSVRYLNFCQMMAHCSRKMAVYLQSSDLTISSNPEMILDCYEATMDHAIHLIGQRLHKVGHEMDLDPIYLKELGWETFATVARRDRVLVELSTRKPRLSETVHKALREMDVARDPSL